MLDFSTGKLPKQYQLSDLLETLAMERRFSNQSPLSVLDHSIITGRVMSALDQGNDMVLYGYTHDFQEAIIRDVPSPFKALVGPSFVEAENKIQEIVLNHFGIRCHLSDDQLEFFKCVDGLIAEVEMFCLLGWDTYALVENGYGKGVLVSEGPIDKHPIFHIISDEIDKVLADRKTKSEGRCVNDFKKEISNIISNSKKVVV